MAKRIIICILFLLIAILLLPGRVMEQLMEVFPFPGRCWEVPLMLLSVLSFAFVVVLERWLWHKWGLHLPPVEPRRSVGFRPAWLEDKNKNDTKVEPVPQEKKKTLSRMLWDMGLWASVYGIAVLCLNHGDDHFSMAVQHGYFLKADMCLSLGADVNAGHANVLRQCCMPWESNVTDSQRMEQVHYLLKKGACFDDHSVFSVLRYCIDLPQLRYLLPLFVEYGADLNTAPPQGIGCPAVVIAVRENNPGFLRSLVALGASPNVVWEGTALQQAVAETPKSAEQAEACLECVRLLLAAGAEVNCICRETEEPLTALDMAEKEGGFTAAVPLLLEHGARRAVELEPEEKKAAKCSPPGIIPAVFSENRFSGAVEAVCDSLVN